MEPKPLTKSIILGGSILIGLFLLGLFIFRGLKTFSDKDRVVTVKGLAEMNMKATSATISLDFSFSGDNVQELIKQLVNKKEALLTYLNKKGYATASIAIDNVQVTDREKNYETRWSEGKEVQVKIDRYTVAQRIVVKSKEVISTEAAASQISLELISKGLTATVKTEYSFPELNSIKPQLIAESTKNARVAGEQFANDSKATLGKIKTASQGQITIAGQWNGEEGETAEKPREPYLQKARVVSTIVFFLE